MRGHDLIFVSMEDWDDVWRRNQFVCAELARRHAESAILFVGIPRNLARHLARGDVKPLVSSPTRRVPGLPNIVCTKPLRVAPERFSWGWRLNAVLARKHVRQQTAAFGLRRPILWLNPHYAVHMAGSMGERAVIYDITDDWTQMEQSAKLTETIRRQDAELCRKADAVIVCSQRLYDMKRSLARNLHLIPNGVDAAHYARVLDGQGPLPEATRSWKRPVFGYTGSIHPDRVDVGLVEAIARAPGVGTLAMVGPDMMPPDLRRRMEATGNVVFTGAVPYAVIPDYMRAFDVCIVPHRMTPFTESLNPIKLWEYLAGGKPIVATDVAGFRDYPQFVRLARTSEEFAAAMAAALAEGTALAEARRAVAAKHSWSSRVDQIEKVIADVLAAKGISGINSDAAPAVIRYPRWP